MLLLRGHSHKLQDLLSKAWRGAKPMNIAKSIVLTGLVLGVHGINIDSARAGDASPSWSGFYAGANIGYGWIRATSGSLRIRLFPTSCLLWKPL